MDPISDVLTLLNIRGAFSSRFEACGPWALRFRSYRYVKIGAIVSGACWLTIDGEPPLRLSSGDCYLLASDRPYEVAGDLDIEPEDGHAVYRRFSGARTVRYGTAAPDAERTVIVGGSITLDEMTSALLLDCLPPVVRIPADSPPAQSLRPVLEMLSDETATEPLGAAVMIEHLTQILFVQALRAHLAGEETVPGWLGALNDPQIGAALTLMHQRATNRWTVAGLAAEVGMSRSSFALRFKTLVGLPRWTTCCTGASGPRPRSCGPVSARSRRWPPSGGTPRRAPSATPSNASPASRPPATEPRSRPLRPPLPPTDDAGEQRRAPLANQAIPYRAHRPHRSAALAGGRTPLTAWPCAPRDPGRAREPLRKRCRCSPTAPGCCRWRGCPGIRRSWRRSVRASRCGRRSSRSPPARRWSRSRSTNP